MSDNGTLSCDVIMKTEIKEEPVDEEEWKNEEIPVGPCSNIKNEDIFAVTELENIAYGALQNEELLPDTFPIPVGYSGCVKEEECAETSLTAQIPTISETVARNTSPVCYLSLGCNMAENQTPVPGTSINGMNKSGDVKPFHKKEMLAQVGSISSQESKDEFEFPKGNQGFNINTSKHSSSSPFLLTSEPSTITTSVSPSISLLPTHLVSPGSSVPLSSTHSLSTAASSSSASPSSESLAAAATLDEDGIVKTGRKNTKRSCPVEALNVVQEVLLNPTPFHVLHFNNLANLMIKRMRTMDKRKRKRVESRLIQLMLEDDL